MLLLSKLCLDKTIMLQAISRTNRKYEKKDYGLIVGYFGISSFLEKALDVFARYDTVGTLHPLDCELPRLQNCHRIVMRYFNYVIRWAWTPMFRALNQKTYVVITYIPTDEGWLYLANIMDLYTRKIVGWYIDTRMTKELVIKTLQ
jgi:transposase InsO family protein